MDDIEYEIITDSRKGMVVGMSPHIVKATHIPTGLQAACGRYKSQHKNREIAKDMILWGLDAMENML